MYPFQPTNPMKHLLTLLTTCARNRQVFLQKNVGAFKLIILLQTFINYYKNKIYLYIYININCFINQLFYVIIGRNFLHLNFYKKFIKTTLKERKTSGNPKIVFANCKSK